MCLPNHFLNFGDQKTAFFPSEMSQRLGMSIRVKKKANDII